MTRKAVFCLVLALLLAGCSGTPAVQAPPEADLSQVYTLSDADRNTGSDDGSDLTVPVDETLTVTQAGTYRLSGLQRGQVCIDVQDQIVHLILEDLELHSNSGPAIYVRSAAKVVLTIPEGTESTISDSAYYSQFPDARSCIFSASDLTINGSGKLNVSAYFADAIRSKDYLKILDTSLDIRAKGDGIRGNDGVAIENAAIQIQCEDIGIHATRTGKPGRGYAAISGGSLSIIAGEYGIHVTENLYLQDCEVSVYGVIANTYAQGQSHIQEDAA